MFFQIQIFCESTRVQRTTSHVDENFELIFNIVKMRKCKKSFSHNQLIFRNSDIKINFQFWGENKLSILRWKYTWEFTTRGENTRGILSDFEMRLEVHLLVHIKSRSAGFKNTIQYALDSAHIFELPTQLLLMVKR